MSALSENQQIGAFLYGVVVLPACVLAAFPAMLHVPVWACLAAALVGGLLAGGFFWEKHPVMGALTFGLSGSFSPFVVASYVDSQTRYAGYAESVEFNVLGLFVGPLVLLLMAFAGMVIFSVAVSAANKRRQS